MWIFLKENYYNLFLSEKWFFLFFKNLIYKEIEWGLYGYLVKEEIKLCFRIFRLEFFILKF